MPWDDETGNKDRKNPWGRNPSSGGPRKPSGGGGNKGGSNPPPDFEDFFYKMQSGLQGLFPSKGTAGPSGGSARILLAGAGLAALLWLSSGFFTVSPGEHAVIQRLGAWNRTVETEGLKYRLPAPLETMQKVTVNEIRSLSIGFTANSSSPSAFSSSPFSRTKDSSSGRDVPDESLMLTSDFNIVDLDLVVQWNIKSASDFLFNIAEPEDTIRKVAQSAVREVVGQTKMFSIITTERGVVADAAKTIMQTILDEYGSGITITQVLIKSAEVHPDVQTAFQDVQSAKQDAEDFQNRAEAYKQDILPKARGQANKVLQEAQAYKDSVVAKANGDAQRFDAIYEAYKLGEDVTKQRIFIETMEEVLRNASKVIVDGKGAQGVLPYLPLENRSASKSSATASGAASPEASPAATPLRK